MLFYSRTKNRGRRELGIVIDVINGKRLAAYDFSYDDIGDLRRQFPNAVFLGEYEVTLATCNQILPPMPSPDVDKCSWGRVMQPSRR